MRTRILVVPALLLALPACGQTYTLDDAASPVRVEMNGATGRFSVVMKSTGTRWSNPATGGADSLAVSSVAQADALHLTANAVTNAGYAVTLAVELAPATGDVSITMSGDPNLSIPNKIRFPAAFYPADGSGYAVAPVLGGYVVPTASTAWTLPSNHSRMEWFGGTDAAWNEGWMCIGDPGADMFLVKQTATVGGGSKLGLTWEWRGTNGAPAGGSDRLTYARTSTLRFFDHGGYVAQATHFREFARGKGWLRTLAEKAAVDPDAASLPGSPVIYLWGDGRSTAMLDALQAAGIDRALVQISINHVDQNNAFPNQAFADGRGWSDAVRSHGYIPGIYDLYVRYNAGQTQPPYNGFVYLWPTEADPGWIYTNADGTLSALDVCAQRAGPFARDTRLPSHLSRFGLGAFFFDVTCAVEPREDYTAGRRTTRTQDIASRAALLAAASVDHHALAGAEQAKSWAVPALHWAEGMYKLGATGSANGFGSFNNNTYPQILTDVADPGSNLSSLLSTGFQAPLWDLVYHDCMLSTQHWHLAHNKLLYCWDQADLAAIIRGQAPLLHLTYNAERGTIGRAISGATDARDGRFWDTRWTNANVSAHVARTWSTVCAWHREVGGWPLTDHQYLTPDQSVQASEFSPDGGASGRGVVVNFGAYDGAFSTAGPTWSGARRGTSLSVPVGSSRTYTWGPPVCTADFNGDGFADFFDYDAFVACYEGAGCPPGRTADVNNDGFADFFDYDAFVGAFEAGC